MFAETFVLLYTAHLLSDYPLQTDHQAAHKADHGRAGWSANFQHAGTHVVVSAALLALGDWALDLDLSTAYAAGALAWIGISHSIIDRRRGVLAWMRLARQEKFREHGNGAAHVDQTAHVVALVLASLALAWGAAS